MADENAAGQGNQASGSSFRINIPPPSKLDLSDPQEVEQNWKKFSRQWEYYRKASKLDKEPSEYQSAVFLACIGEEGQEIFEGLQFTSEDEKSDISKVIEKFSEFCLGTTNEVYESYKFHIRCQSETENIDTYLAVLRKMAKACNFADEERMIRDRIVIGIKEESVREKLLERPKLTLKEAVEICRAHETSRAQNREMASTDLNRLKGKYRTSTKSSASDRLNHNKSSPHDHQENYQTKKRKCNWCGRLSNHKKNNCPAQVQKAQCDKCRKVGHYAVACRSAVNNLNDSDSEDLEMGTISSNIDSVNSQWKIPIKLGNCTHTFKLDTGADVTVVPEKLVPKSKRPLQKSDKRLYGAGQNKITVVGMFSDTIEYNGRSSKQKIYVVKNLKEPLLGMPAILDLNLIQIIGEVTNDGVPENLYRGLGKLRYSKYKIHLKDNVMPYAVSTPRRLALPLKDKVKHELDNLEALGVIKPVTKPTPWCSPIVVVPKSHEDIRLCVDYTRLNEAVMRENFPLPTTDQLLAQLSGSVMFSKLDCNSGFHQIELEEESQELTTFITPYGRYCYTRLPFGISSGPEIFHRTMTQLLGNVDNVICDMDDILVFGKNKEEHETALNTVLKRINEAGLTLNPKKCQFRKESIKFLGHVISKEGISIDPEKVEGITKFPEPTDVHELRRFLGMVNHVSKFAGASLSEEIKPLRDLLKRENEWLWDNPQKQAFNHVKNLLSSAPILAHYATDKKTLLSADSSSYGIGACLKQKQTDGHYKPVFYISRSLTPTEQRYAQVEKEALAVTWACEKFAEYITGLKDLTIETDHKPLLSLLGNKNIDELSPRLQRFRMRLMRFKYEIVYTQGKNLVTADALSRAPTSSATPTDKDHENETDLMVQQIIASVQSSPLTINDIKKETEQDELSQKLMNYCNNGWPEKCPNDEKVKPYWNCRNEITVQDGLLLNGSRIIIPEKVRPQMLSHIHEFGGHQGIVKCRALAKEGQWWPGINKEIEKTVEHCPICIKERTVTPEPLIPTELPDYPWQKVGMDLFELNKMTYLLVVDYYSRYIEIAHLKNTLAKTVIEHLKNMFSHHGIPEICVSDNGPQFSCKQFKDFAKEYSFTHIPSSPLYPQANGEAERAVKTVKQMLKKSSDPYKAMLTYRATPIEQGRSPAEILMGRKIRTTLPATKESYIPRADQTEIKLKDNKLKQRQKRNYDKGHRARNSQPLVVGQPVWVRPQGAPGTIVKTLPYRSYEVRTPTGIQRRNRRQLVQRDLQPQPELKPPTIDSSILVNPTAPNANEWGPIDITLPQLPNNAAPDNFYITRSGRISRPPDRLDL